MAAKSTTCLKQLVPEDDRSSRLSPYQFLAAIFAIIGKELLQLMTGLRSN